MAVFVPPEITTCEAQNITRTSATLSGAVNPKGSEATYYFEYISEAGYQVTPPSGPAPNKLETTDLIAGTGAEAKAGDTVTVNYVGVLYKGGKEFDASWKRKEPFQFKLGQGSVIAGWDQGVVGMNVDRYRELLIPFELLREGNA